MVSIIPAERTPWDIIGQQIGSNLSQTLPGAVEGHMQRQRGLGAIDELQKSLAGANGDISKILPALARAYTLNPPLERSGLGKFYTDLASTGQLGNALGEASGNGAQAPQPMPQGEGSPTPNQNVIQPIAKETQGEQPPEVSGKSADNIDAIANQYLAEVRPDLVNPATQYGNIATFDSEIKQDLTPEEEGRIRNQLMEKYKNPNVINNVVDRVREGIKNKYNEALSKYGFDKEKRAQIQDKWNNFTQGTPQRLAPHLNKYGEEFPKTKETLQNKYNQYAGALPVNMTPEQMHTNAMALLQNDINQLDALNAVPSMAPFHTENGVKDYIENQKEIYKPLVEKGMIDAVKEDAIINKDMGNEEFHSMIWGDQTSKPFLNSIHSLEAPKEYTQIKGAPQGNAKYNAAYPKQHEKYVSDLTDRMMRMGEKDDLILVRAMVLDSGGTLEDFRKSLTEAQNKGLKLSEFQKGQVQEANIPRMRPLWEIFSGFGESPELAAFGMIPNLGWNSLVNYIRGKR
jgi:hypothetical protein